MDQKAEPKLPFTVARCTSEVEEHPATELNTLSPHTSGWLSARFAEFPQEIILQLHSPAHLKQIQVLSHHSSIARRIESTSSRTSTSSALWSESLVPIHPSARRLGSVIVCFRRFVPLVGAHR